MVSKYNGVYIGTVKENVDPTRSGRLRVYIPEFNTDPSSPNGWIWVKYCSPFAGNTPMSGVANTNGKDNALLDSDSEFIGTQTSYGMWFQPPDLENQVAVFFVGGNVNQGYWFGCAYGEGANMMVPGVPASSKHTGKGNTVGRLLPVAEQNKLSTDALNGVRPVAMSFYRGIAKQGLIKDRIRGINSSGARRSSRPSEVYGILTPGPIDTRANGQKGRLGGNQFVMDDSPTNECIVLKTRSGAQIRIDETFGIIYVINRDGTGWLQIDEVGNFDVFAANSISLRSLADINLKASKNINIEAGNNINVKAISGAANIVAATDLNTLCTSAKLTVKDNLAVSAGNTQLSLADFNIRCNELIVKSANTSIQSSEITLKADGNLYLDSAIGNMTTSSFNVTGKFGVTGATDILGAFSVTGLISQNAGTPPPTPAKASNAKTPIEAIKAQQPTMFFKTDVLNSFSDEFNRNTSKTTTIVSRMPTYEPCPEHTDKGIFK